MVDTRGGEALAVTGMAWSTALGEDLEEVWQRLLAGQDGFTETACEFRLRNRLAAVCPSPGDPSERLRRLAADAAARAATAAGLPPASAELVVATSLGAFLDHDGGRDQDLFAWAEDVAETLGAPAPICVSTACSSSADAVLVGAELIRSGAAEACLCGGADVLTLSKRLAHSALCTMSPTRARAFDCRHDGMLLGEGAAFLMLERAERVAARQAPCLAILRGAGSANEAAAGMTAPDPHGGGAQLAIRRSLADGGLEADQVGVVHAHGSATPLSDAAERDAFVSVFGGGPGPLVFATKPALGHTLGATGAMEAIALVLALRDRRVPPIVGLAEPDPEMPFSLPCGAPWPHQACIGLSLTLGFGGFDTALVLEVER